VQAWLGVAAAPAESRDFELGTMCEQTFACYRELLIADRDR